MPEGVSALVLTDVMSTIKDVEKLESFFNERFVVPAYLDRPDNVAEKLIGEFKYLISGTEKRELPVKVIGENAFSNTRTITKVILPDTVNIIKRNAFYQSGVTDIEINSSQIVFEDGFNTCSVTGVTFLPGANTDITIARPMRSGVVFYVPEDEYEEYCEKNPDLKTLFVKYLPE
jgi:hypothetical protein